MLNALLWGAVSGGIALVTGRSTVETVVSTVVGVATGAFVGGMEISDHKRGCYQDLLEFLILTGDAETFDLDKEGKLRIRSPNAEAARAVAGTMTRCSPQNIKWTKGSKLTVVEM